MGGYVRSELLKKYLKCFMYICLHLGSLGGTCNGEFFPTQLCSIIFGYHMGILSLPEFHQDLFGKTR